MPLVDQVAETMGRYGLMPPDRRVLVGISGGVDSVVLLHVLHHLDVTLAAAHVNYQLRGAEAEADEDLVRAYCRDLDVPLHIERFDTKAIAEARGLSVQEAARDLRYAFFGDCTEREGIEAVAVAHHADDQAETMLLNLFRGAGLEGLGGMPVKRALAPGRSVSIIRPLLQVRRAAIVAYAEEAGLAWREDATNASLDYTRSAVRTVILPAIEAHFGGGARDNIARSGELVRSYVDEVLRPVLTDAWNACARVDDKGRGSLDVSRLEPLPPTLGKRLILEALRRWIPDAPYSAAVAEEVYYLMQTQTGRRVEVGTGAVYRDRDALVFARNSPLPEAAPDTIYHVRIGDPVCTPQGTLFSEWLVEPPSVLDSRTPFVCYADADALSGPLVLRTWQAGDRFRPLGMRQTKKVSDYLTDTKVSPLERSSVLVLCAGEEIAWLVGHRMSDTAKVAAVTQHIAKFTFVPV